mmetsp:Transcript_13733/g.41430  ORF Transcript_13733/g.41430 Transcript_13733/m.41430 type:complete len:255 (+) Transcript_13733:26-790(+)
MVFIDISLGFFGGLILLELLLADLIHAVIVYAHHASDFGHVVHKHSLNASMQSDRRTRTATAGAEQFQVHHTVFRIHPNELHVTAVSVHSRADPGLEQFFHHRHFLTVLLFGFERIRADRLVNDRLARRIKGCHLRVDARLEILPVEAGIFVHGNELGAQEDRSNSLDGEETCGQWRTPSSGTCGKVQSAVLHDAFPVRKELDRIRIWCVLRVHEQRSMRQEAVRRRRPRQRRGCNTMRDTHMSPSEHGRASKS